MSKTMSIPLTNIPATTKWDDLLKRSTAFIEFSKQPNTDVLLTIQTKSCRYDEIKDKTILELKKEKNLPLHSAKTRAVNIICYSNKNLGGEQWLYHQISFYHLFIIKGQDYKISHTKLSHVSRVFPYFNRIWKYSTSKIKYYRIINVITFVIVIRENFEQKNIHLGLLLI